MFSIFQSRATFLKFSLLVTSVGTCFYALTRYRNRVDKEMHIYKDDVAEESNDDGTSIW